MAGIKVNGKMLFLGRFKDKPVALKVRREAELKYGGEFAPHRHTRLVS
jgi:hypothetical protein